MIFAYKKSGSSDLILPQLKNVLNTQDKHNPGCQRVARLQVSLAQGVDLGMSGYGIFGLTLAYIQIWQACTCKGTGL